MSTQDSSPGRSGIGPVRGRVWRFDHDVDTDVMAPWGVIARPFAERRPHLFPNRPGFVESVGAGDVIVAGRNWGCGSSREQAPENLALLGVAAVVAESFGRIYFRNAVAQAFPHLVCPGIHEATAEGDELEIDLATATVRNLRTGLTLTGHPYTPDMLAIVEAGGLLDVLRRRVEAGDLPAGPVPAPAEAAVTLTPPRHSALRPTGPTDGTTPDQPDIPPPGPPAAPPTERRGGGGDNDGGSP